MKVNMMQQDIIVQNEPDEQQQQLSVEAQKTKPNEHVGLVFSEKIKIYDPNNGEVILNSRCG